MKNILKELRQRNKLLYWFGWFNFIVAVACIVMMALENVQVMGVSRWLKPMKFYLSVTITSWTMAWLMHHLSGSKKVKIFSLLITFTLFFENGLILLQAVRKTTSHFNTATFFDAMVFQLMGAFIAVFTLTVVFITITFFTQKTFQITSPYLWGIRFGLLLFLFFSIEGGVMVAHLKHTIGGTDGLDGWPLLNWSKKYGDLRIAHFFGIHALQAVPLFGWYVAKNNRQVYFFSLAFFLSLVLLMLQALQGIPLLF